MDFKSTILVGLYNSGRYINAKIQNLLQLVNFKDCSIVLLNCLDLDGESSIYRDFLEAYDNVQHIVYRDHVTLYRSWNDGIIATDSKYIVNSNVDDMLHPEYIQVCEQYLDEHEDIATVSSRVLMTDIPNQLWPNWQWCDEMPFYPYPLSTAGPCPVWRRSLHDKYGYFGDYHVIGDARMWEKWLAGGESFGLIDARLVLYFRNPQSLERRVDSATGRSLRDLDL